MGNNKIQKINRYLLKISMTELLFMDGKNKKIVKQSKEKLNWHSISWLEQMLMSLVLVELIQVYTLFIKLLMLILKKIGYQQNLKEHSIFFLKKIPISILEVKEVDDNFHARFSATSRIYEYKILIRQAPLVLEKNRYWHIWRNLEIEQMIEASNFLVGTHDFTTFRSSICQSSSPVKTIDQICIKEEIVDDEKIIKFNFQARSFLHNQVRSIVGSLEKVGSKKWLPNYIKTILDKKDRKKCVVLLHHQKGFI